MIKEHKQHIVRCVVDQAFLFLRKRKAFIFRRNMARSRIDAAKQGALPKILAAMQQAR
jgi:hypothetical protein